MKDYHSQYKSWILSYFSSHQDDIINASEILAKMREEGMSINQATVYRNLDKLEENGQIKGHRISDKEEKYYQYMEPGHDCTHHLHLYCRKCGRVIHLDCDFMQEIEDHLKSDHGFTLDCTDSVLVGLCSDCQRKEKQNGIVH